LQLFLARYCVHSHEKLLQEPDLILQNAVQATTPLQQNGHDCGLFALGLLLHLAHGEEVLEKTFTQKHIAQFRLALHAQLAGVNREPLTPNYFTSFFPVLSTLFGDIHPPSHPTPNADITAIRRLEQLPATHDGDVLQEENVGYATLPPPTDVASQVPNLKFEDIKFKEKFLDQKKEYSTIPEVYRAVEDYQTESGFRIVIRTSAGSARCYVCASHASCCFRAKFGPKRGTDKIILKDSFTVPFHSGARIIKTSDGRAAKGRFKGRIETAVEEVDYVKDLPATPKDVISRRQRIVNPA
jgi:hypothetical protein